MFRQLSIAQKGLLIVVLLLAVDLFFVGFVGWSLAQTRVKLGKEKDAVDVVAKISHLANLTQKYGVALAQESAKNERDEYGATQDVAPIQRQLFSEIQSLAVLLSYDSSAVSDLNDETQLLQEIGKVFERQQLRHAAPQTPERVKSESKMMELGGRMTVLYEQLLSRYKTIEDAAPDETSASIAHLKKLLAVGLILNMVAALALAYFFISHVTSRIKRLSDNMGRFQRREPLLPELQSLDEIGHLDQLFHEMVSNLNNAARNERDLVDGAYDVICTIDGSGRFAAVNSACRRQWGFEKDDLIGQHFAAVVAESDVNAVTAKLDSLRDKNSFVDFQTAIKCRNQKQIVAHWSCFWSKENKAAFCFVRDVTELNAMEARLRAREEQIKTLMRNVPVGLCVVDEIGTIKSANNRFDIMRNSAQTQVLDQKITEVLEEDAPAAGGSVLERARISSPYRCFLRTISGEKIPAEVTVSSLESVGGVESLVVVEDIRELVRLESIKHDFVVILRKNLQTMLFDLRDQVVAARSSADARVEKSIDRILRNSERLLKLIDELFTLETFGAGRLIGELSEGSISTVLTVAVDSLNDYATQQGVQLRMQSCDSLVMADFDRLVQVVVNLISNAIKFSGPDHSVVVSAENDSNFVLVSIADSGRGVPEHLRDKIFKPYEQADVADGKRGTGLGLPICKTIVEAHFGSIGVRSNGGVGSVFWFRLPRTEGTR